MCDGKASRCVRSVLLAVLLAVIGPLSGADYLLFDDLSDKPLGLIQGIDGWQSSGGENEVMIDPLDPTNQCLRVPSASSVLRKRLDAEGITVPDAVSRMFFFRMMIAERQTFSIGLSPMTSPSEYSDFASELGLANNAPNLDFRAWDDADGNYEVLRALQPNVWYNVWVRMDMSTNEYEVWMNDVPGGSGAYADKLAAPDLDETFAFRTGDASPMRSFYVKSSGGASGFGPMYFDDIYIEDTSDVSLLNPTVPGCRGDLNGDGAVDLADLAIVLGNYGAPGPWTLSDGDMDGDGDIDLSDLASFLTRFGAGCD